MLAWIRQFIAAPIFEDESKTRAAHLLNVMLQIVFVAIFAGAIILTVVEPKDWDYNLTFGGILLLAVLILRFFLGRGYVQEASILLSLLFWVVVTALALLSYSGLRDPVVTGYFLVVAISGALLGGRAVVAFALLSLASMVGIFYVEVNGWIDFNYPDIVGLIDLIVLIISFSMVALLFRSTAHSLSRGLERARQNELAQIEANHELQAMRQSLEERVAERTHELERRSAYLEASVEVNRVAASTLDVDLLMRQVVELIRERFDLYYVGLFLMDETGQWAVLRAGTGQAGRAMLERGHRIRVGTGMIGWSVAQAQSRVALDVRQDAVRLIATDLPDTRTEAAVPLRSRGQVIGALTIQSDQPNAFDEVTMAAFQTIADQVAVALDNARLFSESQAALEATRRAYVDLSREAWTELLRSRVALGFRSDEQGTQKVDQAEADEAWRSELSRALEQGQPVWDKEGQARDKQPLAVPIKLGDEVIGVLDTYKPADTGAWTRDQVDLLQEIGNQLGLALESARLYETTQRRAMRDRLVTEVGGRLRETLDVETVLKTAVEDIYQALGLEDVTIYLSSETARGEDSVRQAIPEQSG